MAGILEREAEDDGFQPGEYGQHTHRMPLGLILLQSGWISQEQLERALRLQREARTGRIGEWLVRECGVGEDRITRALALQWRCPVLSLDGFEPARMALTVPGVVLETTGVVPLRVAGERYLYVGTDAALDASAAFALARMSGLQVESGMLRRVDWKAARDRMRGQACVKAEFERVEDREELKVRVASAVLSAQPVRSLLVRVHRLFWLRMWLEEGAVSGSRCKVPTSGEDMLDCVWMIGGEQ